jgi:hypothetical protein
LEERGGIPWHALQLGGKSSIAGGKLPPGPEAVGLRLLRIGK